MITKLKNSIDQTIKDFLPIEQDKQIIYELCKNVIKDYENKNSLLLGSQEYNELMKYISIRLRI